MAVNIYMYMYMYSIYLVCFLGCGKHYTARCGYMDLATHWCGMVIYMYMYWYGAATHWCGVVTLGCMVWNYLNTVQNSYILVWCDGMVKLHWCDGMVYWLLC